ncbi:MAG: lamin tail domain-containing protein, partial [Verrucomicrobiales bacterium]|nr:lamin tail domain-containing protein [Verrucomicrobiales bacterium]
FEEGNIFEINGVFLKTPPTLGEEWSALRDIYFVRPIAKSALQISEIQYHTYDGDEGERGAPAERFEFVEIRNASDKAVSLTGVALTRGVYFQFPVGMTLEPDGHAVVAADPKAFKSRYGFKPAGKYIRSLSNSGETVTLSDAAGVPIDSVTFSDKAPWPSEADGSGRTLSRKDPTENGHSNDPKNWGASSVKNGSPGRKNVF